MLKIPEPAVVQARLMETPVPCDTCTEIGERDEGWASGCPDCQGSKMRYPLRLECPSNTHSPCSKELAYTVQGMSYFEQIDIPSCSNGFIFNPDPDALTEAIEAKEWGMVHVGLAGSSGHNVRIIDLTTNRDIAHVLADEGLRGQAALQLAVYRAMEGETDEPKD